MSARNKFVVVSLWWVRAVLSLFKAIICLYSIVNCTDDSMINIAHDLLGCAIGAYDFVIYINIGWNILRE